MSVLLNRIIKYLKAKGIDAKKVKKKKNLCVFWSLYAKNQLGY